MADDEQKQQQVRMPSGWEDASKRAQSFVSLARASDNDLAAHLYQVAAKADALENKLFGGDDG